MGRRDIAPYWYVERGEIFDTEAGMDKHCSVPHTVLYYLLVEQ
jgi:hypothetical protein